MNGLTTALIPTGQLVRAVSIANSIIDDDQRAKALIALSAAYGEQRDWNQAEELARSILLPDLRVQALSNLATRQKLAGDDERAAALWQEVEGIIATLTDKPQQSRSLSYLSVSFACAREWARAQTTARSISDDVEKIEVLCQLALSLTREDILPQAAAIWQEAQTVADSVSLASRQDQAYRLYAVSRIQAGSQSEAEALASRKISNPTEQVAVFGHLASSFVKEGQWERVKNCISLIAAEYDRDDVAPSVLDTLLIRLCGELTEKGQWEQAREAALTIPRKETQCRALMEIATRQAQAGMEESQSTWDEARLLCTAQVDAVQQSVADVLTTIFVEVGLGEQAKEILSTLPDEQTKRHVREHITEALVKAGRIEEAKKMADEMTSTQSKDRLTQSIALAQMQAGQIEQARATAKSLVQKEKRSDTLKSLVAGCCQTRQWNLAQDIAREISSDSVRRDALNLIAVSLAQVGRISAATTIVRSIDNPYRKDCAFCDLATILAQNGNLKEARRFVRNIRNKYVQQKANCNISMGEMFGVTDAENIALEMDACDEREEVLYTIASAYARKQEWKKTREIGEKITDEQKQDAVWEILARELAHAGQWPQAGTVFDRIRKNNRRLSILREWGKLLAQPADQPIREQILQHLGNSHEKASLFIGVADKQGRDGRYLDLIHLIQQTWLRANTKDDCGSLFEIVRRLLLHKPEMCHEFWESFAWVESFLER